MSLITLPFGLSLKPRIRRENGKLVLRRHGLLRILSLFSSDRQVEIDPVREEVIVRERSLWVRKVDRTIPFGRIVHIDYNFDSLPTSWSWGGEVSDQLESFSVELVLREPAERVLVARFQGEGSVHTGLEGVLLGDGVIDCEGDQGPASQRLVRALQTLINVPLGTPLPQGRDKLGRKYSCRKCARPSAPRRKTCIYCGGAVAFQDSSQSPCG